MLFGGPGLPGLLGYSIFVAFATVTKQIQSSQMIIQTTKPQNIITNMACKTPSPKNFGTCNFPNIFNDEQSNPILPNDNPNRQIPEYSN